MRWLVAMALCSCLGCGSDDPSPGGSGTGGTAGSGGSGGSRNAAGSGGSGGAGTGGSAGSGATSGLTHGQSFSVSGTFVPKPMAAPIVWDDCTHGEPPSARWDAVYPNPSSGSTLDEENWACRETPFTRPTGASPGAIDHPHSHGTAVAAGGLSAPTPDANSGSVGASVDFDRPEYPFYTLSSWWERVDPAWDPGDYDNNFKLWDWSRGPGWYDSENYWYIDYQQNELYDSANSLYRVDLSSPAYETNDDSVPQYMTPPHVWGDAGADAHEWILRTVVAYWADAPDGKITLYEGDLTEAASPLEIDGQTADPYSGTLRNLAIGGYNRATGFGTNWRYFADMFQDAGEGWFYLTNDASWESSTISVLQPWQSVTEGSATLECNAGDLTAGVVHLHYRLAPWKTDGHAYLGSFTLD